MSKPDPLDNWAALQEALLSLTEEECTALLDREVSGKKRVQFLLRLLGRRNRLRTDRERKEILSKLA